ncbi:MAG: serine/threonine-protein kinase [Lysobacterales bacterium]
MSNAPLNLRQLFDAAIELPEHERTAWLDQHCPDAALRERVDRLLRAQERSLDPLAVHPQERLAALDAELDRPASERRSIGDFTLIRPVGQGGMATVFLAERSGFAQRVAVKLLHRTVLSDLDRRLFERERKALASLEHPNIARLIDGGVSERDEPYLVMEYVEGLPITDYVREHGLLPAARIALLIEVCDAVATAHAQLIVHRDLKPSNVLVTSEGRCKLLDFGVAKFLSEETELTRQGGAGFTPEYAAPEQLLDGVISTATDVYALGVMALELLIGSKRPELRKGKPSQSALQVHADDATLALTQRSVARYLRGDLDNILQKCLIDEPHRRYQSAQALADDLRRFLSHQPVSAHPPSRWYLMRKFALRHRGGVIVTALLTMATLASLVLALWFGQQARVQAELAQALRADAEQARQRTETALKVSESVQDFLTGMFDEAVPSVPEEQEPSVRDLVLGAEKRVETDLADAPEAAVELYRRLAQIYQLMGDQAASLRLSATAVRYAAQHLGTSGASYRKIAFADARLRERAGDPPALADMEQVVKDTPTDDHSTDAIDRRITLGAVLSQHGRGPEGMALLTGALPLLRQNCDRQELEACRLWATTLTNLAAAQISLRDYEAARAYAAEALPLARRYYSPEHHETAAALGNLGMAEFYLGHFQDALDHTNASIALLERIEGPKGTNANYLRQILANLYGASGRKLEALAVHERVLADLPRQTQASFGAAVFRLNYAKELVQVGRHAQAREQIELIRPLWESDAEHNPGNLARMHEALAVIASEGDHDVERALSEIDQALAIRRAQAAPTPQELIMTLLTAHRAATLDGVHPKAEAYLTEARELLAGVAQPLPWLLRNFELREAEFAADQGDVATSRRHLQALARVLGPERPDLYADWAQYVELKLARVEHRKPTEAEREWQAGLAQRWGADAEVVRVSGQLIGAN